MELMQQIAMLMDVDQKDYSRKAPINLRHFLQTRFS